MGVLVTRPAQQGAILVDMLNKAGIASLHFPVFDIQACEQLNTLPHKLAQMNSNDYVVMVSRNAVDYAYQTLLSTGFTWRADLQYFSVGQSSAERFCELTGLPITYPYAQQNSEGLLALTAMQTEYLAERQILLLRGNEGRPLFPEQIQQRGATLDIVQCYQRQAIPYIGAEQVSIWKRAGINTLVVTSGEILRYLLKFVPLEQHHWLKHCRFITISQRIALLARQQGWQHIFVSERPNNRALFSTLVAMKNNI
ncbi:uroporphyrinogen-III synthase [Volucribacter amazonae]|uniref:Uroporphyrinogen-III synthase n=1 Tax=Volucribacter amazonae TaxID=256731 RepID=A0A9X4PCY9_9PAST|nr:uroporphyrinogen-III synthase [Volucribacter amazonae]MDG6895291.1 uroporphyrinogen-III synthase [Volucribacter amazonae]